MEDNQQQEPQGPQEPSISLRARLIQTALEQYIDSIMYEMIEWDKMEAGLQTLLTETFAFETKVAVHKSDELMDKGVFSGTITLQDYHNGELVDATISFTW